MREPLYKVGEECILQSEHYPQYNGNTVTILGILNKEEFIEKYGTLDRYQNYYYETEFGVELTFTGTNLPTGVYCNHWGESSLRKKYPPSKLSFQEIIQECKSNVVY